MPKFTVKLFARARDLAGSDTTLVELPEGASVADLRAALVAAHPALAPLAGRLLVAAGTNYARDTDPVPGGVDLACFPPVSGG